MLIKKARTAKELETEISNYLGGLDVIVYEDGMHGWTAAVFVPQGEVANTQQFIQIVSELRAKYDLEVEPEATEPPTEAEAPPREINHAGGAPDPSGRGSVEEEG
jgi:hypothetical protein